MAPVKGPSVLHLFVHHRLFHHGFFHHGLLHHHVVMVVMPVTRFSARHGEGNGGEGGENESNFLHLSLLGAKSLQQYVPSRGLFHGWPKEIMNGCSDLLSPLGGFNATISRYRATS
jgi:hypothetical protein